MPDPRTFWLTVTNLVLGLVVILLLIGVATGVLCEFVSRFRKRRSADEELERDMHEMFPRPHARK